MLTKSLLQCRACRLTWFPQRGAGAACPACGGVKVGGTLELFHVGLALIAAGSIGWLLRHGPPGEHVGAAAPAVVQSKEPNASVERGTTSVAALRERRVSQVTVSSKKIKSRKVKRRQKKANTRSKHVQR